MFRRTSKSLRNIWGQKEFVPAFLWPDRLTLLYLEGVDDANHIALYQQYLKICLRAFMYFFTWRSWEVTFEKIWFWRFNRLLGLHYWPKSSLTKNSYFIFIFLSSEYLNLVHLVTWSKWSPKEFGSIGKAVLIHIRIFPRRNSLGNLETLFSLGYEPL